MKRTTTLLLVVAAIAAFSEQSMAFMDSLTEATYEVPVTDPNLKSFSIFDLKKVKFLKNGDNVTLKYLVPQELTGERNKVEFEGSLVNGQGSLIYKDTKMDCLTDQSLLMCKVTYESLKFDQVKADQILASKFQGADLEKRMMVQKGFSTDPVGIIKIKLK